MTLPKALHEARRLWGSEAFAVIRSDRLFEVGDATWYGAGRNFKQAFANAKDYGKREEK